MQAVREYAVVRNRQLILELPDSFDNTEVEVLVFSKDVSESQKVSSYRDAAAGCSSEDNKKSNVENRKQKKEKLTKLFQSWCEDEDETEQRETWEYLKRALDEDRLSDRRLFP